MFSVDNSSYQVRQNNALLVPSRYTLKVGDIEVLVISDGVLPLTTETIATNKESTDVTAWLGDIGQPEASFHWPLNVIVVRSGGRTVLIDGGIGDEFPDFPRTGHLAQRLEAAGVDFASVTDVVITHLHIDHIGGFLSERLGGQLRPDVPIHLAAAEVKFWASPDFSRNKFPQGFPEALSSAATRFLNKYQHQLRTFETTYEVAPGVVVSCIGGHTPGHSVVRLASSGARLTFLGDSVFQNHFAHPDWHNGFDHDPDEAVRVRIRLLQELAESCEPVVAAHVSFPYSRVAVDGDVFRCMPVIWEY